MPRTARVAPGGLVYHIMNQAAGRRRLFRKDADFEAFEQVMLEAHERCPLRILSYCFMPNHWQFVAWPKSDGELTEFFRWLAHTHSMRCRATRRTAGQGPLYRGRYKNFPVQRNDSLLTVCRHVERSALTAGLVKRAQQWRWSSLAARTHGSAELREMLSKWPVTRPRNWVAQVNAQPSAAELEQLTVSVQRSRPFGSDVWTRQTVARLHLEHTVRSEGRPKKA